LLVPDETVAAQLRRNELDFARPGGLRHRGRPSNYSRIPQGNQTVFFQIANGNSRQACSVKTKFPTQQQASRYLRQNWNKIEQMARDCLAKGSLEGAV
jgi:hypothetical protein